MLKVKEDVGQEENVEKKKRKNRPKNVESKGKMYTGKQDRKKTWKVKTECGKEVQDVGKKSRTGRKCEK